MLRAPLLVAVLMLGFALPAAGEEVARPQAKVTASVQGGFARVQFDWPEKAAGKAQLADGVVVITFDKSFDADTEALARTLEPYVALARLDRDGKTLRLALKGPARLKVTDYGTRYAVDLAPPSYVGDPPAPLAPDPFSGGGATPKLNIRATERERTTRLQFDFPGEVDYTAKQEGGKLWVSFSKDAKVDLKRFKDSPPGWVRGARAATIDGKLRIEFDVDAEADFHDVSKDGRIVLELSEPKTDEVAAATTPTGSTVGAPKSVVPPAIEEAAPPPPKIVAESIPFPLPSRKAASVPITVSGQPASNPHPLTDAAAVNAAAETMDDAPAPAVDANPLPLSLRVGHSDLEAMLAPAAPAAPAEPGKARAEIFGSMLRLELPFTKLPAAAVFRRGVAVWVITATPELMDLSALAALPNAPARVLSAPAEIAPGITAFRLEAPAYMAVSAAAAGNSWVVAVGNTVPDVPAQTDLVRQTAGAITKLRAFLPGARQVVWVKDPQAEDRIAAVLSFAPARGLASGRQFVEFNALSSQQGLAVQAIADDLTVAIEGSDAVVARPRGLNISDQQFAAISATWAPLDANGNSPAFADFAAWSKAPGATRAEAVRRLMRSSSTSPGGMSGPRMALARFYVAEGFGAEALGVLGNIAREDQTADSNTQFRVARAIANIEMARYRDALTDLSMDALGNDPHAALWRGLAAAGARDWRLARSNLMGALRVMNRYPAAWEGRGRVALAQAALALGEPASAMQALSGMPRVTLPTDVTAEASLVRAALDVVSGKTDVAIALYDQLAQSPYRPAAVRGALEGTLLKVSKGKMKADKAIDALERLRFQWRGDEVELKTLTELGKLYVANNRTRDGLNTMRLAVRHFSNSDEARATATQMAKIFEGLFLEGKADTLPPVQALALFYDFRELTPAGGQGDEMIRKLAERLVAIDLLPQAAELLQYQVDNRLDGIPKASVATRLALIYLLDRKAEKALNLIRSTKQTRLPDDLILQRNLIEARALTDLKMYDEAFDLIATEQSQEAERLRADIMWDARRWPDAAAKTEALLGNKYEDFAPLTDIERMDVMRASVAYSFAGDALSLERLRTRFGAKMAQSPDSKAFAVVTQNSDVTGDDYKNLIKRVASADTLEAFLAEFRAKYGQGGQMSPLATPVTTTPAAAVTPPAPPATATP